MLGFIYKREHYNAKFSLLPLQGIQIWPKIHRSDSAQIMIPAIMELHKQPAANAIKVTYMSEKSISLNPNIPHKSELRVGLHGRGY